MTKSFLPFNLKIALVCVLFLLSSSSCKKENIDHKLLENTVNSTGNGQVTEISGATWEYMDSSFVANKHPAALICYKDKLIMAYLSTTNGGPLITSGHLENNEIVPHNFGFMMSGLGFQRFEILENDLYALGILDFYGSFKMNTDYLPAMGGLAWDPFWGSQTNQYSITKIGDEIIGSFAASPFIRSYGQSTFPNVEATTSLPKISKVINYNGDLICAGLFDSYNGTPLHNIARWNGSSWEPLGAGLNSQINDLIVLNGKLIACGNFTKTGDESLNCRYVASWNGSSWSTLGEEIIGGFAGALTLCKYGDQLFVGGDFTGTDSVYSPNILKWKDGNWFGLAGGVPLPIGEITICKGHLYVANANYTSGMNFLLRLN